MLNRMLMLTEWGISAFTETRRWLPPLLLLIYRAEGD